MISVKMVLNKCQNGAEVEPSGLDISSWKIIFISFKNFSADLFDILTCRVYTEYQDSCGLNPLVACRLIALENCQATDHAIRKIF